MRIIAGSLKGRQFEAPRGRVTHPMSDKARGGLFSSLGDISGLTVLDCFAGSGALSLEALSRGAKHATVIEQDKTATKTIHNNTQLLKVDDGIKITQANVSRWSDNNPELTFDLIFCDPPYDRLQLSTVQKLVRHMKHGGVLVLSWPAKFEVPELVAATRLLTKSYGDATITFYKR